jgi:Ca2+-binding RTX toxin-like protein
LLEGGDERDELFGQAGDDLVNGGSEDDVLWGGRGFDELNGQQGTDRCTRGPDGGSLRSCERA